MTRLFSYCIPYDDGAAPNPYWGWCTLVICKPRIRRVAMEGDWIAGTGSQHSPIGDASGKLVHAMRVTKKMTMPEYDEYVRTHLPGKVPDWWSEDPSRRVGDAIYDFSTSPPTLRPSVHDEGNQDRDLGGRCALLSDDFYYFGDHPVEIPRHLRPIVRQGQGHRSVSNDPYVDEFIKWVRGMRRPSGSMFGKPQCSLPAPGVHGGACATVRGRCAEEDERIRDDDC